MKKLFLFIGLTGMILSSCTLQKRSYRDGYYLSFNHSRSKKPTQVKDAEVSRMPLVTTAFKTEALPDKKLIATLKPQSPGFVATGTKFFENGCDSIFFKNGDIILARVQEINPGEIKYKNCNNTDGPLYVVEKKSILRITYSNGTVETISAPVSTDRTSKEWKTTDEITRARGEASDAFVFSLIAFPAMLFYLSGIVLAIFAIIKARRALSVLMRNPRENMKSIQQARNAITIACIAIGLVVALIALLLVILFSL